MRTAQHDNPKLNVREWTGRDPVRIVIDRFLKLNEKINLFDGSQKTLAYNVIKHEERKNTSVIRVDEENFLENVIGDLYAKKIQSMIVEGGAHTLQTFIDAGVWDEARVFVSPHTFGDGIKSPEIRATLQNQIKIKSDWLKIYVPKTRITGAGIEKAHN